MTTKMLRIFVLLCVGTMFGLQGCRAEPSTSDSTEIRLGRHVFVIPKAHLMEQATPDWLRWFPGLDDGSRDVLLRFGAAEVARGVPGYAEADGDYAEDVVAVIAVLNPDEIKRYQSGERLADLWYGTGSYTDAIVEPLGGTGWHKVYRKVEYPYSWAVLKQLPTAGQSMPSPSEFWIAQCLAGDSPLTPSGKRGGCKSHVSFGDLVVDFEVSEQNLRVIDGVAGYLTAKVTEWRRS